MRYPTVTVRVHRQSVPRQDRGRWRRAAAGWELSVVPEALVISSSPQAVRPPTSQQATVEATPARRRQSDRKHPSGMPTLESGTGSVGSDVLFRVRVERIPRV